MKDKDLSFKIILGILIGLLSIGLIFGIYFVFKCSQFTLAILRAAIKNGSIPMP